MASSYCGDLDHKQGLKNGEVLVNWGKFGFGVVLPLLISVFSTGRCRTKTAKWRYMIERHANSISSGIFIFGDYLNLQLVNSTKFDPPNPIKKGAGYWPMFSFRIKRAIFVSFLRESATIFDHFFVRNARSSQVNTLPKAKSKNPQQAEQGHSQMQQCV